MMNYHEPCEQCGKREPIKPFGHPVTRRKRCRRKACDKLCCAKCLPRDHSTADVCRPCFTRRA